MQNQLEKIRITEQPTKKVKKWKRETHASRITDAVMRLQPIGKQKRISSKNLMIEVNNHGTNDLNWGQLYMGIQGAKRQLRASGWFMKSGGRPKGYYIVSNRNDSIEPLEFDMKSITTKANNFIDLWQCAMYHFTGAVEDKREVEKLKMKLVKAVMGW